MRLKAKRGIVMLSVDKFLYPRKQTRGNEFIPCSDGIFKNVSAALESQLSLSSGLNHWINTVLLGRIAVQEKSTAVVIAIVTSSVMFLYLYISHWWRQTWDTCVYFTVVSQSEVRVNTEHGIKHYIDGSVQERHNSSVLAMELRLSCTDPSIYNELAQP